MSAKTSEQIVTNIDDKYIYEAMNYNGKSKHYIALKRIGKIAACFVLVFVLSLSSLTAAAAAGNRTAYDILYFLYPDIAMNLIPVNEVCEDQGIQMEVAAVYVHDDSAEIYISMQDLIGSRIDETIDLFDSYSIHTSADQIGGCSFVDYNEETQTASFLISVRQMNGKCITGKKMTFSVSEFLSGKKEVNEELIDSSLENIPIVSDVQTEVNERGSGGGLEKVEAFLIPNDSQMSAPVDGVAVTGYGFVDNRLHVQVYYEDIVHYDNHGYVYLKDAKGNVINCVQSVSFWDDKQKGSYDEYIFDLNPEDDLSGYSMWGYFMTCKTRTTGEWQVTFPIR